MAAAKLWSWGVEKLRSSVSEQSLEAPDHRRLLPHGARRIGPIGRGFAQFVVRGVAAWRYRQEHCDGSRPLGDSVIAAMRGN
jgi:hypothetical protein